MTDLIKSIDREVLLAVNHSGNAWLDKLMIMASDRFTWIPFYLLLAFLVFYKHRRQFIYILIAAAVLILLSDQASVFFKNAVQRYRPCHNIELTSLLHLPDGCGGLYGFPSSHAVNTGALSVFLILFFVKYRRTMFIVMSVYCLLVGYSRIYLGRHYVTDILSGWILGALTGLLIYFAFQKIFPYVSKKIRQ
jgi:undecaprenyl-diphosphatase